MSNEASKRRVPNGFQKRKKAKWKQFAKEIEGTRLITGFLVRRNPLCGSL